MKILLMILMLFGLGCTAKAVDSAKQVETVQPVETKEAYCPLSVSDCRNMQERVASGSVHIQPILVTDGKNPEAMKNDWKMFVESLPEEIASALEEPKVITIEREDIQEQEDWAPQLDRDQLAKKIGALPMQTLAVVYWDIQVAGNYRYDWDHGIYYRSYYAELTSADRSDHLGRSFEAAFLAWLINIHV